MVVSSDMFITERFVSRENTQQCFTKFVISFFRDGEVQSQRTYFSIFIMKHPFPNSRTTPQIDKIENFMGETFMTV